METIVEDDGKGAVCPVVNVIHERRSLGIFAVLHTRVSRCRDVWLQGDTTLGGDVDSQCMSGTGKIVPWIKAKIGRVKKIMQIMTQ